MWSTVKKPQSCYANLAWCPVETPAGSQARGKALYIWHRSCLGQLHSWFLRNCPSCTLAVGKKLEPPVLWWGEAANRAGGDPGRLFRSILGPQASRLAHVMLEHTDLRWFAALVLQTSSLTRVGSLSVLVPV